MSEENKQFEIKLIQHCFEKPEHIDPENDIAFIDYWSKRSIAAPNGELFWLLYEEKENLFSITSNDNIIAKRCAQIAAETSDIELKQRAEKLSRSGCFIIH